MATGFITNVDELPESMKAFNNWELARMWNVVGKTHNAKNHMDITLENAKSDDPRTWGSFANLYNLAEQDDILARVNRRWKDWDERPMLANGKPNPTQKSAETDYTLMLGFELGNTNIACLDVDETQDVQLLEQLKALTNNTYAELSSSGNGWHFFFSYNDWDASLTKKKAGKFELYHDGRFIAMTGDVISDSNEIQTLSSDEIKALYRFCGLGEETNSNSTGMSAGDAGHGNVLTAEQILRIAPKAKDGRYFKKLMNGQPVNKKSYHGDGSPDPSNILFQLINELIRWTDGNKPVIDAVIRKSKAVTLLSADWDKRDAGTTYGDLNITNALTTYQGKTFKMSDEHASDELIIQRYNDMLSGIESQPEPDWDTMKNEFIENYKIQHNKTSDEKIQLYAEQYIQAKQQEWSNKLETQKLSNELNVLTDNGLDSLAEIEKALRLEGDIWRKKHTHVNEKTGEEKVEYMDDPTLIEILQKHLKLALLIDSPTRQNLDGVPLHYYNPSSGLWQRDTTTLDLFIRDVDPQRTKKAQWDAIIDTLRVEAARNNVHTTTKDINLVPVENGIYDMKTHELKPFASDYYFTSKIRTAYNPQRTNEPDFNGRWKLSNWIENDIAQGQEDKIKLLYQTLKAGIIGAYWLRKAVILIDDGTGSKGKGTFQNIIMNVRGEDTYASIRLNEFEDPNKLADAYGKGLIIGDDNHPKDLIRNSANLKSTISDDVVGVKILYQDKFTTKLHCFVLQSCNGFPHLQDSSRATFKRFAFIKFIKSFDASNPDNWAVGHIFIQNKEWKEWLLKYLLDNVELTYSLTQTKESAEVAEQTRRESNSVTYFIDVYLSQLQSTMVSNLFMYSYYKVAMYTDGKKPLGKQQFTSELQKELEGNWDYIPRNCDPKNGWVEDDKTDCFDDLNARLPKYQQLDPNEVYNKKGACWVKR